MWLYLVLSCCEIPKFEGEERFYNFQDRLESTIASALCADLFVSRLTLALVEKNYVAIEKKFVRVGRLLESFRF